MGQQGKVRDAAEVNPCLLLGLLPDVRDPAYIKYNKGHNESINKYNKNELKRDKVVSDESILTNSYSNNWEFVLIWNKSGMKLNLTCIMGSNVARLKFLSLFLLLNTYCVAFAHQYSNQWEGRKVDGKGTTLNGIM